MSLKQWFGSSVVTDSSGAPLEVYHATNFEFSKFERQSESGADRLGPGFYFTRHGKTIETYGSRIIPVYLRIENPVSTAMTVKQINDFFDNLKVKNSKRNGYNFTADHERLREIALRKQNEAFEILASSSKTYFDEPDFIQALLKSGIDGVISSGRDPEYVVFDAHQIKSSTRNNGNYDISDANIYR